MLSTCTYGACCTDRVINMVEFGVDLSQNPHFAVTNKCFQPKRIKYSNSVLSKLATCTFVYTRSSADTEIALHASQVHIFLYPTGLLQYLESQDTIRVDFSMQVAKTQTYVPSLFHFLLRYITTTNVTQRQVDVMLYIASA